MRMIIIVMHSGDPCDESLKARHWDVLQYYLASRVLAFAAISATQPDGRVGFGCRGSQTRI